MIALWLVLSREGEAAGAAPRTDAGSAPAPKASAQRTAEVGERLAADQRFRSRGVLMSPAEASLFATLRLLFGDECSVFAKVRTADLLEPVQSGREGRIAFNEISQKHLDFVVCRNGSWEIVCAIELDDGSHRRSNRIVRDNFVDTIFSGAGIPLFRVPARAGYTLTALREQFAAVLPAAQLPFAAKPAVTEKFEELAA